MTLQPPPDEIRKACNHLAVSIPHLWVDYFGLGGVLGMLEIDAFIYGASVLEADQFDLLAHAVNERLLDAGEEPFIRYSSDY